MITFFTRLFFSFQVFLQRVRTSVNLDTSVSFDMSVGFIRVSAIIQV